MTKQKTRVHDVYSGLVKSAGDMAYKDVQEIPDEFFSDLADLRAQNTRFTDDGYTKVASVPAIVVNQWMREGFNIYTAPAAEIEARLRRLGYDELFATTKRVFVQR